MRLSLFYNPFNLIERLAVEIQKTKRIKRLKNSAGKNLKQGHTDSLELLEIISMDLKAPIIFDIGANIGTWTLLAKSIFPESVIHAFEPLENHVDKFNLNCKKLDSIYLHPFCAGNENNISKINISSFSDSSSLLEATPLEFKSYNIKKVSEADVSVKRLSDLIKENMIPIPDLIKLDIQGFELEALRGLNKYLHEVRYIICEVSFKEYYKNQALFLEIANYLSSFDHHLFALGHNCPVGKELHQIDVLFKHKN